MNIEVLKIGLVSCSGEAIPGGTVSRLACRLVMDDLRPGETVTICLPLFIAGGKEEREFAAKYPTITVDGCEKRCAQRSTEQLSGSPARSLLVPEILRERCIDPPVSLRNLRPEEKTAVQAVADEIAEMVDEITLVQNK